jgi:SAM-dependent methyltransferase
MAAIKSVHEFKDAWRWPEDVERFIRKKIPEGRVLNVPAGKSPLGDVQVDADASLQGGVIPGDMQRLPFKDAVFDGVVADPPWKSVDVFDRHSLFYELVRVTKPGGLIIHNASWIPDSNQAEKVGEYRRADDSFHDVSVISVFRRYGDQATLGTFGSREPITAEERGDGLTVRDRGQGATVTGTLEINGPDGRVLATKRYRVPPARAIEGVGENGSEKEFVEVQEEVEYEFPDAANAERAASVVPPRRGVVRIPQSALDSHGELTTALSSWFRGDPKREYRAVRRRLGERRSPQPA